MIFISNMIEGMEDNENSFVALWSERIKLDCAVIYVNSVMPDDPFFNRVTDIRCEEFCSLLDSVEGEFENRNAKPFVYFIDNERLEEELLKRNYVLYDTMHVLLYERYYELSHSPDIEIRRVERNEIQEWVNVYCLSFDSEKYRNEVSRVITNSFDRVELCLAYVGGSPAGCAALFEKGSFLGLYCLGTLEKYRKAGIATALIPRAAAVAKEMELQLLIQSFEKDKLVNYYVKRGFTQIYTKKIYGKL